MRRVSITLTNELEAAVSAYRGAQEVKPSLTSVVQTALRQFLIRRHYLRAQAAASEAQDGPRKSSL